MKTTARQWLDARQAALDLYLSGKISYEKYWKLCRAVERKYYPPKPRQTAR